MGRDIEGILRGPRRPKKGQVYLSDLLPLDLDRSGRVETRIALGSDLDCKAFQVTQFAGLSADADALKDDKRVITTSFCEKYISTYWLPEISTSGCGRGNENQK